VGRVKADLLDNHGRSISATYVQRVSDAVGLLLTTKGERWQYALPDDLDRCSVKALSIGVDGTCVLAVEGGYKQAMAGTISLLNRDGDRLHTIYVGSAPESGKKTFLRKIRKELSAVIKEFPKATVVGVADGAQDNCAAFLALALAVVLLAAFLGLTFVWVFPRFEVAFLCQFSLFSLSHDRLPLRIEHVRESMCLPTASRVYTNSGS